MTIKQFLSIIGFATLLCWGAFAVVLWNIDPFEANMLNMAFFYVSFFLALAGTVATGLYGFYHFFGDVQIPVFKYVKKSMTQATIAAALATFLLLLQGVHVLNPWTGTFIILLIAFFVSLSFSHKKPRSI